MANKRFTERGGDEGYEGEQNLSGMGKKSNMGGAKSRDNVGNWQKGDQTNPMTGTGSRQPQQAEYPQSRLNKQWR